DMHGNCVALDAVLADLKSDSIERMVCLGDAIQGGPQPKEVVARLRALACPVVMGNADAWLLTGNESGSEEIPPERRRQLDDVREWTLAQLAEEERAYIASFEPTIEIPVGTERNLLCFHGSPTSFDDLIFPHTPEEEVQRLLGPFVPHILTGGHTHLQQIRRLADSFFFNPGSVGLVYDHQQSEDDFHTDPWAEYAVLTAEEGRLALEFRRVTFDVAALIHAYRTSGRPYAADAITQYQS
ncbi:MAG: metallophosphoesterase family protein, partial [Ardenticatenaceae bacterium]